MEKQTIFCTPARKWNPVSASLSAHVFLCAILGMLVLTVPAFSEENPGIPAELKGFQGMVTGKVIEKSGKSFSIEIASVKKVWKNNRAENPSKAKGKVVKASLDKVSDHHGEKIMKNFRELKEGDKIEVELFDLGEKSLCVKEWLREAEK